MKESHYSSTSSTINMNREIVCAILQSSKSFVDNLENENDLANIVEKLPVIDSTTAAALSKSLADLISFKVSPEIYQRYSETLREWLNPPVNLANYQTFCHSDKILELCERNIEKYFQINIDDNSTTSVDFIAFSRTLINLAKTNSRYIQYIKDLVDKIIKLEINPSSCELVKSLLECTDQFKLEFSTIEKLYVAYKSMLIEEPLIDCFVTSLNVDSDVKRFSSNSSSFDKLITYIAVSPKIFQLTSIILKNLFRKTDYSSLVLNYAQFVFENIKLHRPDDKKSLIDLYPINLQACIILLQINPHQHTKNSRNYVLQRLNELYTENKEQVFILMIFFPVWLNLLSTELIDIEN